jgi:hypothetical protein
MLSPLKGIRVLSPLKGIRVLSPLKGIRDIAPVPVIPANSKCGTDVPCILKRQIGRGKDTTIANILWRDLVLTTDSVHNQH